MLSKQIIWQTKHTTEPPAASSQGLMAHHTLNSTSYVTMSSGWMLTRVNIDPTQEIEPKVGGWAFFTRLWYKTNWVSAL